jgi:hypothetical protein
MKRNKKTDVLVVSLAIVISICLKTFASNPQEIADVKGQTESISSSKLCSQINSYQDSPKESQKVCEKAVESVVKIQGLSDISGYKPQGSGFIIKKTSEGTGQYKYSVLSNAHVLKDIKKGLSISTFDKAIHSVKSKENDTIISDKFDLSIVFFVSSQNYPVLSTDKNNSLNSELDGKESKVDLFVVGYPFCKEINC